MKQVCEVREQCFDALQERMPRPLVSYRERGCGFENVHTVSFCPKRRRYLDESLEAAGQSPSLSMQAYHF